MRLLLLSVLRQVRRGRRCRSGVSYQVDASWERIQQAVISTQSAGNLLGIGQKVLRGAVYVAIEAWGFSDFLRIRQVQGLSKAGSQIEGCGQPIRLDAVHIGALGSAAGSPKLLRLALGDGTPVNLEGARVQFLMRDDDYRDHPESRFYCDTIAVGAGGESLGDGP